MNGIDAMATIRRAHPQARIIVLTIYEGEALARRAHKAGTRGYILKDMIRTELLEVIRTVYTGRKYIPRKIAPQLAEHYAEDDLIMHEIAVLREIARGTSNQSDRVASVDFRSRCESTVQKILLKLGASDRTHAVNIATTRGFLV
jgi:two-component system NarL family response regulator